MVRTTSRGGPHARTARRPVARVRPSLASRRPDRRRGGGRADRPEEPGICRDRRHPAPERPLRRRGRGDPVRRLRHEPADLDGAELRAGRGRGQRGARGRAHRPSRTRPRSSPGSRSPRASLFLLVAVLRMGWIAQFLSRAVVTGFLFGAAIDVVIGELPKLTGTEVVGVEPAPGAVVLARHARRRARGTVVVGLSRWSWSSACGASRPGARCPGPRGRRSAGHVAVRPR